MPTDYMTYSRSRATDILRAARVLNIQVFSDITQGRMLSSLGIRSEIQGGSNMTGTDLYVNKPHSYGDTLPHTVVGVCGEFQRTGRFLQRGI